MTNTAEAIRTDWPAHCTTNAQAERAKAIKAERVALDRDIATRHGRSPQYLKPDGLQTLHDQGELTSDQFRAGQRYQRAWETLQGGTRSPLDMTPPGDQAGALDAIVDAGRTVDAFEACCTTRCELEALRLVCGAGRTARQVDSKPDRVVGRLIRVLDAAIKARA